MYDGGGRNAMFTGTHRQLIMYNVAHDEYIRTI